MKRAAYRQAARAIEGLGTVATHNPSHGSPEWPTCRNSALSSLGLAVGPAGHDVSCRLERSSIVTVTVVACSRRSQPNLTGDGA